MYTIEQLIKYSYFDKVFDSSSLSDILDPLTGVISRPYIVGFAQYLIRENIPFTYGILDLDNFKFINDTYGHTAGDKVLQHVGDDLIRSLQGKGVAGRFGGDEYLFINLEDLAYNDKKKFLVSIYTNKKVLRRNIELNSCKPFITGTIGCASFPEDAVDYDSLFAKIDKTLYRGKSKGRNCYIIYVEEKHKGLEIQSMAGHGLYASMYAVAESIERVNGIRNKMKVAYESFRDELRVSDLYYVDGFDILHSISDPEFSAPVPDISNVMHSDFYSTNSLEEIAPLSKILYETLHKREIETVMLARVGMGDASYGYVMCAEPHSLRIWQDDEIALLFFLAKLIAAHIAVSGEKL